MPSGFILNPMTGQYDQSLNMGIGSGNGIRSGRVVQPGGPNAWNGIPQTDGGHLSADGQTWVPGGKNEVDPGGGGDWMAGQSGPTAGTSMGSGIISLATGGMTGSGSGGYSADAQLKQVNSQFAGIMDRGLGKLNEQAAMGGGFSGGIPYDKRQQFITDTGNDQNAAIERIMNDITGRNQNYELAKSQAEWQKQLALMGGGSQRYSSGDTGGNQNQELMDMFNQLMGGQGGGGQQGQQQGGGGQVSGGRAAQTGMSVDPRTQGTMALAKAYYDATGKWGSATDHQAWASSIWDENKVPSPWTGA